MQISNLYTLKYILYIKIHVYINQLFHCIFQLQNSSSSEKLFYISSQSFLQSSLKKIDIDFKKKKCMSILNTAITIFPGKYMT